MGAPGWNSPMRLSTRKSESRFPCETLTCGRDIPPSQQLMFAFRAWLHSSFTGSV